MLPRAWKVPHIFWAFVTVPMLTPVRLPLKVPFSDLEPLIKPKNKSVSEYCFFLMRNELK
jgi:hypothetical protein